MDPISSFTPGAGFFVLDDNTKDERGPVSTKESDFQRPPSSSSQYVELIVE